jgi:sterol desaturase/sphingolipid hydroxylase (fatty acid hydroxylase superfamily)
MIERVVAAVASLALLAAVFVPLERLFPARPEQRVLRRELALDAVFFFGQYLVWNAVALTLLAALDRALAGHAPAALRAIVAVWPWWLQAALAVVLGDACVYWFHRACHRFDFLWQFHAVHHSAETLDFVAAHREHPLDGACTQLCANLPAFVLGFDTKALAALIAFRGMWAIFVHSNVRLPLGPLRVLFGAPELHHWHHARVARTAHNFANVAPWLDVLFGTYHCPKGPETYPLGLVDPWPRGYARQLAHPFVVLARRAAHVLRRTPPPRHALTLAPASEARRDART